MRKISAFVAGLAFMAALSVPAYAGNYSSVVLNICPDVSELEPGEITHSVEPAIETSGVSINEYSISSGSKEEMKAYYYDFTLITEGSNTFADSLEVTVKGAASVEVKSLNKDVARVRAKTYPFYRLKNVRDIDETGDGFEWKKSTHAKKYNIIVYYEDEDGDIRTRSYTSTTNKLDVSSLYEDYDILAASVQAIPGSNDTEWRFLLPSQYIASDDGQLDPNVPAGVESFYYPSASGKKSKGSSSSSSSRASSSYSGSSSATSTSIYQTQPETGWIKSPQGTWFKNPDGSWPHNGWQFISGEWYFFNEFGYIMPNAWILWDNGIDGAKYYKMDSKGAMLVGPGWTDDGFYLDENGVWIESMGYNQIN